MGGTGTDEEWVKSAMSDDAMVVDLLVRLHRAPPPSKTSVLPLEWSVRQRRSISNKPKKPAHSHRASPTTPLSATSFSSEDSSRPKPTATRSKIDVKGEKTISKRSRKKKTLAELRDEESSLLKERRDLKREISVLLMNLESQRAINEKLKRMKIEFRPSLESTSVAEESISGQFQQESTALTPEVPLQQCSNDENDATPDFKFNLPDLNIPFDEPNSDDTCKTIEDAPLHRISTEAEQI